MNWQQIDHYAMKSTDGCYSVAKYGSEAGRFTYAAWRTLSHPSGRLLLAANLPDANTAKARCELESKNLSCRVD